MMTYFQDPAFPDRPTHPDFMHLADVILMLDGKLEDRTSEESGKEIFARELNKRIDAESITYMANQRACRLLDITTLEDLSRKGPLRGILMATYLDAFCAGMEFQKKHRRNEGPA